MVRLRASEMAENLDEDFGERETGRKVGEFWQSSAGSGGAECIQRVRKNGKGFGAGGGLEEEGEVGRVGEGDGVTAGGSKVVNRDDLIVTLLAMRWRSGFPE